MPSLYLIGGAETTQLSADVVGSKAANLARMAAMGLAVPPAFVIPTSLCAAINAGHAAAEAKLDRALSDGIAFLEQETGRRLGDRRRPLLVSVRSGAARSMPGMLETVLDVGCTIAAVGGLIRLTGNPRFAWDCRRRLVQGYGETVLGLAPALFDRLLDTLVREEAAGSDRELDGEALERLCADSLRLLGDARLEMPEDPAEQLAGAARAVFRSWASDKAATYRKLQGLDHLPGTAVTVQAMVFGNADHDSAAGVAFSRDPSTGAAHQVIDLLFDAQGEDVVSGRRTPESGAALALRFPSVAEGLAAALTRLEKEFAEVQDVEFTIESGKLWLLQTRAAKRSPRAALTIAVDLVDEGLIDAAEALERLADLDPDTLAQSRFSEGTPVIAEGIAAAPGVAAGRVAFDIAVAVTLAARGDPVILVRPDTSTADVAGFAAAAGILTAAGGRTAHAALVARQMGKPCIVGCGGLAFDPGGHVATIGALAVHENDWLSIDGDTGTVHAGKLAIVYDLPERHLKIWQAWQAKMLSDKPK